MPNQIIQDLRARCGPARDQGSRPTCLAFAASDTHAALRTPWVPLSSEFVFYHAQRRAGRPPNQGTTLPHMLETLQEDGQPVETGWPYLTTLPSDIKTWAPPTPVGDVYRRRSLTKPSLFNEIVRVLDEDRPALIAMMLSDAFYRPGTDGVIDGPGELPDKTRRHAVVAVGRGVYDKRRRILIRNSWGSTWGIDGYAWLTESFLTPRLIAVAVLTEDIYASSGLAA